jgi:hypothetical protein
VSDDDILKSVVGDQPKPESAPVETKPEPERQLTQDEIILNMLLGAMSDPLDTEVVKPLKIHVYSDPGGRKSTFLGTIPNSLIWDVDLGMTVIYEHPEICKLDSLTIMEYKSFNQVAQYIRLRRMNTFEELKKHETVSIDTMSNMHKRGLQEIMARGYSQGINPNPYTTVMDNDNNDHAENNEHIRQLVDDFRQLPCNLVITSHARTVQQKDKSLKYYPDYSEKLGNTLNGMMDVVAFVEQRVIDGVPHVVWHCNNTDGYIQAKNRIGLPDEIIDPTWDIIWGYYMKHLEKARSLQKTN